MDFSASRGRKVMEAGVCVLVSVAGAEMDSPRSPLYTDIREEAVVIPVKDLNVDDPLILPFEEVLN